MLLDGVAVGGHEEKAGEGTTTVPADPGWLGGDGGELADPLTAAEGADGQERL